MFISRFGFSLFRAKMALVTFGLLLLASCATDAFADGENELNVKNPFVTVGPGMVIDCQDFDRESPGYGYSWEPIDGGLRCVAEPNETARHHAEITYQTMTDGGSFFAILLARGRDGNSDSVRLAVNGAVVAGHFRLHRGTDFGWTAVQIQLPRGFSTISILEREPNAEISKLVLTRHRTFSLSGPVPTTGRVLFYTSDGDAVADVRSGRGRDFVDYASEPKLHGRRLTKFENGFPTPSGGSIDFTIPPGADFYSCEAGMLDGASGYVKFHVRIDGTLVSSSPGIVGGQSHNFVVPISAANIGKTLSVDISPGSSNSDDQAVLNKSVGFAKTRTSTFLGLLSCNTSLIRPLTERGEMRHRGSRTL